MLRFRFEQMCTKALSGHQFLVRNQNSEEEGVVTSCIIRNHRFVVKTPKGEIRCWDYRNCYEIPPLRGFKLVKCKED